MEGAHFTSVVLEPHPHVLHLHLVVLGRLDDQVVAFEAFAVDVEGAAFAGDVERVFEDLVVDADAQLAAGARADVVAGVDAQRFDGAAAERDADARAARTPGCPSCASSPRASIAPVRRISTWPRTGAACSTSAICAAC